MSLKRQFTAAFVKNAPIPKKGEVTYTSTDTAGLTLRVLPSGVRTLYARIWDSRTRRTKRIKIGDAAVVSLAHARKTVAALRAEVETGRHTTTTRTYLVSDAFSAYCQTLRSKGVSRGYEYQNDQAWARVPKAMQAAPLDDVTHSQLSSLILDLYKKQPGTAYSLRRLLRGCWRTAIKDRMCRYDPTIDLPQTKIEPRRDLLSDAELSTILRTVREDAAEFPERSACFLLLAATGQRTSEVRTLEWKDVQSDCITFPGHRRKQGCDHTVYRSPLADEALALLDRGIGAARLFSKGGRGWMASYAARLTERTGIPFHMHMLRKSLISRLMRDGVPVHIVAGISGHKDTSVLLKHYAIPEDADVQAAVQRYGTDL